MNFFPYISFVIEIIAGGFSDSDMPISYKYMYYLCNQEYLDEIKFGKSPVNVFKNTL